MLDESMSRKKIIILYLMLINLACLCMGKRSDAANAAVYKIETKSDKYLGEYGKAWYSYQLPKLKGETVVIKKINTSLQNSYLKTKKQIFSEAKKCDKLEVYGKFRYIVDAYESYNENGYISFMFTGKWGNQDNLKWNNIWGETYCLKTGKKLTVADALSLSSSKAKNKIANAYVKKYSKIYVKRYSRAELAKARKEIKNMNIKKIQFFLFQDKIQINFGPDSPGNHSGVTNVVLKAKLK